MTGRLITEEGGGIAPLAAVLALGMVFVAGMAYDGGQLVAAHDEATDVAVAASRAGAQQTDVGRLRAGQAPALDPSAAVQAAEAYIGGTGHDGSAALEDGRLVATVVVEQPMLILPIGTREVTASASSALRPGIEEADRP